MRLTEQHMLKYSLRSFLSLLLFSFVIFNQSVIKAGPWIEGGDVWLRADIEYLSDRGIIKAPITTWPIMWSGIKKDLDRALDSDNLNKLTLREQDTLLRLKREFRKATQKLSSVAIKLASDTEVLRGFADTPREESEIELSKSDIGDMWAYKLNVQYVNAPYIAEGQNEGDVRFDGSYVATIFDNFSIGYGYIEKWWGPGWDSSLILSNNARPSPGVMIQRNYSDPFESKWLSWIGPWTMNVFANVLDDERHINDAMLLGMSVSFKPFDSLEIGLRRTAQWAGEGRPKSLSSLFNLSIGRGDNCPTSECRVDEPGNQLAGIDVRWRLPIEQPISLYFQLIGEDEAGYLPGKKSYIFGLTSELTISDINLKYFIEYSDTSTNFGDIYNITYNHAIYQTGYRYQGRSIGSSYDNDTTSFVLGTILSFSNEKRLFVQLSNNDLNIDDVGLHTISTNNKNFTLLSVLYKQNMQYGELDVFLNQYSDIIDENLRQNNETRLGATWKMTFN